MHRGVDLGDGDVSLVRELVPLWEELLAVSAPGGVEFDEPGLLALHDLLIKVGISEDVDLGVVLRGLRLDFDTESAQ